eukprot:scaffold2823_cov118-Isochrysis_galbana.AAC.2
MLQGRHRRTSACCNLGPSLQSIAARSLRPCAVPLPQSFGKLHARTVRTASRRCRHRRELGWAARAQRGAAWRRTCLHVGCPPNNKVQSRRGRRQGPRGKHFGALYHI